MTLCGPPLFVACMSRRKCISLPRSVRRADGAGSAPASVPSDVDPLRTTERTPPLGAAARRALRLEEFERMKRQSLTDASAVAILGTVLAYVNSGAEAAEGLLCGSAFGIIYLLLLQRDVDLLGTPRARTPFDLDNPLRILRLLLPLAIVGVLGLQAGLTLGFDAWLNGVRLEPTGNFSGVISSPTLLYGALVGYCVATATLPARGTFEALPEARELVKAVPGSVGVALKLAETKAAKTEAPSGPVNEPAEVVPVLLVTGPRGCGKSTLVSRVKQMDSRFSEPEWVMTREDTTANLARPLIISEPSFESLAESGGLVVNYQPCGDDLEQINIGLPALSVLAAALESGACVLDVDPTTAQALLQYDWTTALYDAFPDKRMEIRLVSVWISLPSLDSIVERNKVQLEAQQIDEAIIKKQLALVRAQSSADMEWALTSGSFDFTVFNEAEDEATKELTKAARYCFEDPF